MPELRPFAAEVDHASHVRCLAPKGRLEGVRPSFLQGVEQERVGKISRTTSIPFWCSQSDNGRFATSRKSPLLLAPGDLSLQKSLVDVKGEILELKNTISTMVDHLKLLSQAEVTRVAREVGCTEGKLGGFRPSARHCRQGLEEPHRHRQQAQGRAGSDRTRCKAS